MNYPPELSPPITKVEKMLQTITDMVANISTLSQHHWQSPESKAAAATASTATSSSASSSSSASGVTKKQKRKSRQLPVYTLAEVSEHWMIDDCWIILFDRVYDVTEFLEEHPGGSYIMLESGGRDATLAFRGSRHTRDAYDMLDKYLIGVLPEVGVRETILPRSTI